MFHLEEAPGKTQDALERLYLLAGLGMPWCTPGKAGGGGRATAPATWPRISRRKWMGG